MVVCEMRLTVWATPRALWGGTGSPNDTLPARRPARPARLPRSRPAAGIPSRGSGSHRQPRHVPPDSLRPPVPIAATATHAAMLLPRPPPPHTHTPPPRRPPPSSWPHPNNSALHAAPLRRPTSPPTSPPRTPPPHTRRRHITPPPHLERHLELVAGQRVEVGAGLARGHLAVGTRHTLWAVVVRVVVWVWVVMATMHTQVARVNLVP